MERGTIRFSGPTAELLDRKDLLAIGVPVRRRRIGATSPRRQPASRRRRAGTVAARSRGSLARSAATAPSTAPRSTCGAREIVGMIGPNGAGKTTIFDLISGFVSVDSGRVVLDGRDISHDSRPATRARRPRSQLPGCAAVPRHDRRRDAGRVARALGDPTAACSPRRCDCPRCSTTRNARGYACDELIDADEPRRLPQLVRPRAVDRHAAHRRPRLHRRAIVR